MTEIKKRVLLINVPSRRGKSGLMVPMGLLYVGGILERAGHSTKIYDPHLNDENLTLFDRGDYSVLDEILEKYNPDIVGFGGIASSYGRTKKLSGHVKKRSPSTLQMAGGPLASVYTLLLTNTKVDVIFHGETERSLPLFLKKFCDGVSWSDVPGISTRCDGTMIRNPLAPQIENLDDIPLPAYHLIDLKAYDTNMMYLLTSRGCTNKCSFCYRHMKGHRQNSVQYVINHMKFAIDTLNFSTFSLLDELFNANKQWVLDFCDSLEKEKITISFITSMRADKVDEFLLKRLKDVGCTEVLYGQESGSDIILNEYRKGVDAKTNTATTLLTRKQGLKCPVQIVIGSPSETPQTIEETTKFLINLGKGVLSINYLIPYPETPIWEYVEQHHLVPDVEQYLDEIAHWGGSPVLNLTRVPDNIWRTWSFQIKTNVRLALLKKEGKTAEYLSLLIVGKIALFGYSVLPKKIIQFVRDRKVYG
ncbi:MAG: radical SAM protein [Methanoregulaceae archaeon]|jgi:radical SAM superfamily enzyme YgiQ (UPF0313 family)